MVDKLIRSVGFSQHTAIHGTLFYISLSENAIADMIQVDRWLLVSHDRVRERADTLDRTSRDITGLHEDLGIAGDPDPGRRTHGDHVAGMHRRLCETKLRISKVSCVMFAVVESCISSPFRVNVCLRL